MKSKNEKMEFHRKLEKHSMARLIIKHFLKQVIISSFMIASVSLFIKKKGYFKKGFNVNFFRLKWNKFVKI